MEKNKVLPMWLRPDRNTLRMSQQGRSLSSTRPIGYGRKNSVRSLGGVIFGRSVGHPVLRGIGTPGGRTLQARVYFQNAC